MTLVLVHAAATWFMAGAIVFVQTVHDPLFSFADPSRFRAFAAEYGRRTAIVVVPAMGFDANAHRALVATNWVRTGAWVARAFLAAAMLERAGSTP